MFCLTLALCAMSAVAQMQDPDTLFFDDFSSPGTPQWTYGPYWGYYGGIIRMYASMYTGSGGLLYVTDTLRSPPVCIPQTVDSLILSIPMQIDASCSVMGFGSMYILEQVAAEISGAGPAPVWEYYVSGDYGEISVDYADSLLVAVPDSAWASGDSMRVCLIGELMCDPDALDGILHQDWIIESVALLGYSQQGLSTSTWGSIKAAL